MSVREDIFECGCPDPVWAKAPLIRRLAVEDLAAIEHHLLTLEPIARRWRFHSAISDWAVSSYARGLKTTAGVLVGATECHGERIVGLAEAHPAAAPRTVDVAISVLASHRRRGLGGELVNCAVAVAFAEGAAAAEFLFDPDNVAAARIVARLGARSNIRGRAVLRAPAERSIAVTFGCVDE